MNQLALKEEGDTSYWYALSMRYIGNPYYTLNKTDSCLEYLHLSLTLFETNHRNHPDIAMSFNNLGNLYKSLGDYEKAEKYYLQSLEIRQKIYSEDHPDIATSFNNLGLLYSDLGDYEKAEKYYLQSLEIRQKIYSKDHPYITASEYQIAKVSLSLGKYKKAYELLTQVLEERTKDVAANFEWLSDVQQELYWGNTKFFYENVYNLANKLSVHVPEASMLSYNAALIAKGKLLESKISKESYFNEIDDLRSQIYTKRNRRNKIESESSGKLAEFKKLNSQIDSLDKLTTLAWPAYAEQKRNLSITWTDVHINLNKDEAAIEFIRFYEPIDSAYYYQAVLIRGDANAPIIVTLCNENSIEKIRPQDGYESFYTVLWSPLEAYLEGISTIYYSPTHLLNNIPFHALYKPASDAPITIHYSRSKDKNVTTKNSTARERVYLMDKYSLHQLTSTRYLAMDLKKKENEEFDKSIELFGGINYHYISDNQQIPAYSSMVKKNRFFKNRSINSSNNLEYLQGTLKEIKSINELALNQGWQVGYLEWDDAKEEKMINLQGREAKGILHFATHGYSFPKLDKLDSSIKTNSLQYSYRYSKNPMVRSGLILTGGYWAWNGSDTLAKLGAQQNGLLTALEVSGLNLRRTKLVVLSACGTGLGQIGDNEGTFGLKRGFKLAGVDQIIVSFWDVPDDETQELMVLFYKDLIQTSNSITSFRNAQKKMRLKYPLDPDKWAGFILVR
jgi:CHAT domain-containing protein